MVDIETEHNQAHTQNTYVPRYRRPPESVIKRRQTHLCRYRIAVLPARMRYDTGVRGGGLPDPVRQYGVHESMEATQMKKWLFVVESNCSDPEREQEFDDWYNETHLPDMLEVTEIVRATRYRNVSPQTGEAKYLALYEFETDDLAASLARADKLVQEKAGQGRISALLQTTRTGTFELIYSLER
jgi:hypothetical protein